MQKKNAVIVHSSSKALNIRIFKEINANDKYNFTFLSWSRDGKNDVDEVNCLNYSKNFLTLKAPYGKFFILFLPIWWIYVFFWLIFNKWDIVHVVNFDSAIPIAFASKIKGKKSIYELLETYEDGIILPMTIRNILVRIDKLLMSFFDAIILVDTEQIKELNGIPNKNIAVVYDSPPDTLKNRDFIKKNNETFTIFYAGVLYNNRKLNIDKLMEAITTLDGVKLIIAGYGNMIDEIKNYEKKMPNKVNFIGKISYEEVMERAYNADLLFQLRDPSRIMNKYICGSTLFNSMIAGTPILVNKGTSTAIKVHEANCGVLVDANNIEEIRSAIIKLRDDPELCGKLGKNARSAYEQVYNWEIMEKRLYCLYNSL